MFFSEYKNSVIGYLFFYYTPFANQDWLIFTVHGLGYYMCDVGKDFFIPDKWYFLAVTYNGSQQRIFVNAEEPCPAKSVTGTMLEVSAPLIIGADKDDATHTIDGFVDEVRIYSESFSSAQIRKLYAEGAKERGLLVKENKCAKSDIKHPVSHSK